MDERRSQRVSEAVREELTEIIGFEMEDPRLRPAPLGEPVDEDPHADRHQDGRQEPEETAGRSVGIGRFGNVK